MNSVFEKYRKYIVTFQISGRKYYTIWGADLSDKDEQDKYLCNSDSEIIIFKDKKEIINKINSYKSNFFDIQNFQLFSKHISKLEQSQLKVFTLDIDFILCELDKMKFSEEFLKNYLFFKDFVDVLNLIGDYATQFKDKQIAKELWDKDFRNLWEHFYDLFLWKDSKYDYKNSAIKKTTSSKDKVVMKFELLLLNFSSKLASFN